MKGFIVFEIAPPFRWKPAYETSSEVTQGPRTFRRVMWLWFSVTLVTSMKWTEFIKMLMASKPTPKDDGNLFV